MISLTLLLICYNPRDNIESELIKTGAMTEMDIAQVKMRRVSNKEKQKLIAERKSSNGFKSTSRRRNGELGSYISVESNVSGRYTRRSSSGSSRFAARNCRVSPETIPNEV